MILNRKSEKSAGVLICFLIVIFYCSVSHAEVTTETEFASIADTTRRLLEQDIQNHKISEDILVKKITTGSVSVETHKVRLSNGTTFVYWYATPGHKPLDALLSVPGVGTIDAEQMAVGFAKEGFVTLSFSWWPPNGAGSFWNRDIQKDIIYNAIILGIVSGNILKQRNPELTDDGYGTEGSSYGGVISSWIAAIDSNVNALSIHASSLNLVELKGKSRLLAAGIPTELIARFQSQYVFKRKMPKFIILRSQDDFFPLEEAYDFFSRIPDSVIRIFPNVNHGEPLPVLYFSLIGDFLKAPVTHPMMPSTPALDFSKTGWYKYDMKISTGNDQRTIKVYYTQSQPLAMAYFREIKAAEGGSYRVSLNEELKSYFIVDVEDWRNSVVSSFLIRKHMK